MTKNIRGTQAEQERSTAHMARDVRSVWRMIIDGIASQSGLLATLIGCIVIIVIFPGVADIALFFGLICFWFSFYAFKSLPFKLPITSNKPDKNNSPPGSNQPGPASGIFFFGNEEKTQEQLWLSNGDMRTHVLVFGSTGSGKTEALISISYSALIQGSGFIYVDGKGDNALYAKIFAMARKLGREDDLLVINFMTGANDITGPQAKVLSNTLNPFSQGSSSMLAQLVVSMMDDSGGASGGESSGDMWKGRAIAFIEALLRPLVYLRDHGFLLLDAGVIRKYFTLESIEELLHDRKVIDNYNNVTVLDHSLPFDIRDPLDNYLSTLPGYQKSAKGKQSAKAYEQHGYITMQLTRIFGSLADTYGHIIKTNLAEVDFKDIILNRRILVVLLPALEKSPAELSNLGKLIVSSLRAMLAAGLGEFIEGEYRDVIDSKPTNSNTPFLCILDEYGYYAVKGFAVVPAQARSLGFAVIFAGQDLPAFQKASKEEAASICANTNIKICMKLEDPQETWEFFQKTAGETYVAVTKGFNTSGGASYSDTMEAQYDKRAHIDILDLKDQREGEAHIFFKSKIIRSVFFYAAPPRVKRIRLNQFLKVKGPSDATQKALKSLANLRLSDKDIESAVVYSPSLAALFEAINLPKTRKNLIDFYECVDNFLSGKQPEEEIDFGDQSGNSSIFMSIPIEERLRSEYFDAEVSHLQESMLTKEKLYEAVKRLSIIEGKSEDHAKEECMYVINTIESQTSYASCNPKPEPQMIEIIQQFIKEIQA